MTTTAGPVRVLRVDGEVDLSTAPALAQALTEALAAPPVAPGGPCREHGPIAGWPGGWGVVVDLAKVPLIDASGLRVLSQAATSAAARGAAFSITGCRPFLRRVFTIVGLENLLSELVLRADNRPDYPPATGGASTTLVIPPAREEVPPPG